MATNKPPAHLQSSQLWEHRTAPLIFGILQRAVVHLIQDGRDAAAEQRAGGECVLTIVDRDGVHHLSFQVRAGTYRVCAIESDDGQPPRRIGEAPLRDLSADWVEDRLGQFSAAPSGKIP
jgi:hypothetical protein